MLLRGRRGGQNTARRNALGKSAVEQTSRGRRGGPNTARWPCVSIESLCDGICIKELRGRRGGPNTVREEPWELMLRGRRRSPNTAIIEMIKFFSFFFVDIMSRGQRGGPNTVSLGPDEVARAARGPEHREVLGSRRRLEVIEVVSMVRGPEHRELISSY